MKKHSDSCKKLQKIYQFYKNFTENYLSQILLLTIRIWIGLVFVKSGLTKIANFDQTISLFAYEYNLPLVSPKIAALSATFFGLSCGGSIILGFLTRITAVPLLIMTIVIQSLVFQNDEHFYWGFLLLSLISFGPGKISLDKFLSRFCSEKKNIV